MFFLFMLMLEVLVLFFILFLVGGLDSGRGVGFFDFFFLLFSFFIGNKMGNGVSVFSINVDGENIDIIKLKILVFEFKKEFKIRDVKLWCYEVEFYEKLKFLEDKCLEIFKF